MLPMTSLSDSSPTLTQLCGPCQVAFRSGAPVAILEEKTRNPTKEEWTCALCTAVQENRIQKKKEKTALTQKLVGQLTRAYSRVSGSEKLVGRIDDGEDRGPIGDSSDVILLSEETGCLKDITLGNPSKSIMRVVPLEKINTILVKRWIASCEENHTACKYTQDPQHEFPLVLIDVYRRCLVRSTSTARYFALSYVWGSIKQLKLSTVKFEDLEEENSLNQYWSQISPVLKDAMAFISGIGERHIWADTVCIVHDSPERYVDIARMNDIYKGAVCTLVAVDGVNATSRLPGVGEGTRDIPLICSSLSLRIGKRRSELASIFANSKYEQRAWTFQERMLSRRCLYFTKEQLYFHCQSALWSEDRYENFRQSPDSSGIYPSLTWSPSTGAHTSPEDKFEMYIKLTQQYTRRQLSFASDRLNAFCGISNTLAGYWGWDMVCGMPALVLDRALLWVSSKQFPKRVESEDGDRYLPSWAWAGWTERVHYRMVSRKPHTPCIANFAMTTIEGVKTYKILQPEDSKKTERCLRDELDSEAEARLQSSLSSKPNFLFFTTHTLPAHHFTFFSTRLVLNPQYANEDAPDSKASLPGASGLAAAKCLNQRTFSSFIV